MSQLPDDQINTAMLDASLQNMVQTTATTGKMLIAYVVGGLLLYFAWKGLSK